MQPQLRFSFGFKPKAKFYMAVRFNYFLSIATFQTNISQGSVETYVRCGVIFKCEPVAN